MDATDINWEPILEMLPTQEMKDYDERMKYKKIMIFLRLQHLFREMFDLFNVNDQKGLTIYEIENGINDMTQTGDLFDRLNIILKQLKHPYFFILVRRLSMMPLNLPPNLNMRKQRTWRKNWTLSK